MALELLLLMLVNASYLWNHCKIFQLTKNTRLSNASSNCDQLKLHWFNQWLLDVGEGKIGDQMDDIADIQIPDELLVSHESDPIGVIVDSTYPYLLDNSENNYYLNDHVILVPTLVMVNKINEYMSMLLPGDGQKYFSSDSICKGDCDFNRFDELHSIEYLNSLNFSGLPPHRLLLKVGVPIILFRNIDQASGLCNGTCLCVTHLGRSVVGTITLNGSHPNQKVLIPRMNINPSETR